MKRRKAYPGDLPAYYDFVRVIDKAAGVRGYRYILDKPLSACDRERLSKYQNVTFSGWWHKYAPEICGDCVILWDKCHTPATAAANK